MPAAIDNATESLAQREQNYARILYGTTILLSSFLLFLVQPMLAKSLTPWLGGSAAVWATCLLFFQGALLAGYLYAHLLSRIRNTRLQIGAHLMLLVASCAVLPLAPAESWKAIAAGHPVLAILGMLTVSVGLPYLLLSSTSPLVQSWYAATVSARFPYRLYALSNFGSFVALLGYPVAIEPFGGVKAQMHLWSLAYGVFAIVCISAAALTYCRGLRSESQQAAATRPALRSLVRWTMLAATGSTLLASVTNAITQDVAPVPFLWVLPLALYLLSFVLCFERDGWYGPQVFGWLVPCALVGLFYATNAALRLQFALPIIAACFFCLVMLCHGELARTRPPSLQLTSFYLAVAVGGAVGGLLVAVLAPLVFTTFFELPLALIMCLLIALERLYGYKSKTFLVVVGCVVVLVALGCTEAARLRTSVWAERNFYGSVAVKQDEQRRTLMHGRISHGSQFLDVRRTQPTTYYGRRSGIGLVLAQPDSAAQKVALIGLGAGTLAAYGRAGDTFDVYELNPAVVEVANTHFSYTRDSPASVHIILGDARLSLEARPPQGYDVIAVDAFSGDAIPIHLLTNEAFREYRRHLTAHGVVAFHITNRYLDLAPVVQGLADANGYSAIVLDHSASDRSSGASNSVWVLVTRSVELLRLPEMRRAGNRSGRRVLWTDDFSNLFAVIR